MKKLLYGFMMLFTSLAIMACDFGTTTTEDLPNIESVENFSDYDDLKTYLSSFYDETENGYVMKSGRVFWPTLGGDMMLEDSLSVNSSLESSVQYTSSNYYSQTNNQVEGVNESDIVITDGTYIYIIAMNRFVLINAFSLEIIYSYSADNLYLQNMYLVDNHVVLMGSEYTYTESKVAEDYYYRYHYNYGVKVIVLDLTNLADINVSKELYFDQSYLADSRMIDGNLYLIMNNYYLNYGFEDDNFVPVYRDSTVGTEDILLPAANIYYMPNDNYSLSYLLIASVNVLDDAGAEVDAYIGSSYQLYMSENNLYSIVYRYTLDEVTGMYDYNTYILRFAIVEGKLEYRAMGVVSGSPLNQFSMDEYEGHFRIATTDWAWDNEAGTQLITNQLYILDATQIDEMTIVSRLGGLGKPNERIYAVRFVGDEGYVVTFVNTDPMYKLDLSDPEHPEILGELYEEGVSDYLHPMNDQFMIGVGRVSSNEGGWTHFTGVKVTLYNIEGDDPVLVDSYFASGEYSYTPVTYDHKMFVYYQPEGADYWLVAIPVFEYGFSGNEYDYHYQQNLYVFKVTFAGEMELLTKIPVNFENNNYDYYYYDYLLRGLFIGDFVYTISYRQIKMFDITNEFTQVGVVDFNPEP